MGADSAESVQADVTRTADNCVKNENMALVVDLETNFYWTNRSGQPQFILSNRNEFTTTNWYSTVSQTFFVNNKFRNRNLPFK